MPYQPRQNGEGRIFSVKIEVSQDSVVSVHNETLTEATEKDFDKSLAETAVCDIACTVV